MKTILIYEHWSAESPVRIGSLYVDQARGKEVFSFEYEPSWILQAARNSLDPDLGPFIGRQYLSPGKELFGVFRDSCPDRWGRKLLERRERMLARRENRKPRKLLPSDELLGIFDPSRMGGLRFRLEPEGPFLSDDLEFATPPMKSLRSLEEAARRLEHDDGLETEQWLKLLLGPGSSLGGARPKAGVEDEKGNLWIAKFPSRHDDVDVGAWEMVAHELARRCGLTVSEARLEKFSSLGSTFLVRRFDRQGSRRIHFASAMTLLGKVDGESASYLDLAALLKAYGARPREDLVQLWKRIVFSMAVSNTDDHLRNHGFLLTDDGWSLSPLYDVNPVPEGDQLSLTVDETASDLSLELALSVAGQFGLSQQQAQDAGSGICSLVQESWASVAKSYGIPRQQIEVMRPAFVH